MRSFSFTLLLFGLLGLLVVSVPAGWEAPAANSVGEYEHGPHDVEVAVDGLNLDLGSKEVYTFEPGLLKLETRARGRGMSRSRSRPKKSKTRRPKKNRKTRKNKTKSKKTKSKKNKTKKNKNAKKSKCNRNAKKGKHGKRAPANACPAPTPNYIGALRAAQRKHPNAQLEVGKTYMFVYKAISIGHARLIVGKVTENREGQLDFKAYSHGLVKITKKENEQEVSQMKQVCRMIRGATCKPDDMVRWSCSEGDSKRYKFKGEAIPEFADPDHVQAIGTELIERDLKYTVYYNNCWKFAKDAVNVGKGLEVS